jgi:CRISPR/Cas system-associated exonuclease Cas4 (RecB family)
VKKPSHLSHSSLSQFDCPRRGFELVIKKSVRERNISLCLGSAFHNLFATLAMLNDWDLDAALEAWPVLLRNELDKGDREGWTREPTSQDRRKALSDGAEMIKNSFDMPEVVVTPFTDKRGPWVESSIELLIAGRKIVGYIDIVRPDPEGDGVIISDYKTSKAMMEGSAEGISDYRDQLELYAIDATRREVKVSGVELIYPRLKQTQLFPLRPDYAERAERRVARVADLLARWEPLHDAGAPEDEQAAIFIVNPDRDLCRFCPVKEACQGPKQIEKKEQDAQVAFKKSLMDMLK